MGSEGLHTALVAQTAGVGNGPVAADDGDTAMSQANQRIHGAARGLPVVGGDAGQVVKGQHGGGVGDHNAVNVNAPEIPDKVLVVAAQEQNAQMCIRDRRGTPRRGAPEEWPSTGIS